MHRARATSLALMIGTLASGLALAAPAQADSSSDAFLAALTNAGLDTVGSADVANAANAVALGQSVCPMLVEPGQSVADVAAKVADASGMSLGAGTMFTGIAISAFCPTVMSSIGSGVPPIPLSLLGI